MLVNSWCLEAVSLFGVKDTITDRLALDKNRSRGGICGPGGQMIRRASSGRCDDVLSKDVQ